MSDELKACPFCGETLRINNARLAVHSRNSECLLRQQPIVVDDKDQVERWNTRATHPAAASVGRGEAVEVVAYIDDGGALYTSKLLEIMSVESDGCEPLMTVAQHQRILAASVGSAEPVAYAAFADNGNIRMWCRSAIGMCELFDAHGNKAVPLYTHPADQVEDGVVVSRTSLRNMADELECGASPDAVAERLRALLANSEGVKP